MYRLFPDKDIICRNIWCFTAGVSTSAGNKERQKKEKTDPEEILDTEYTCCGILI